MVKIKRWGEIATNVAIVFVSLASLFATVSWISSSRASGPSSDRKTAALAFMMLRLEAATDAYTKTSEANVYLTTAELFLLQAQDIENAELKSYLENRAINLVQQANFNLSCAENAENLSNMYSDKVTESLDEAEKFGKQAESRSTGAILFTITAIIGSCGTLLKRREIVFAALPIFAIAAYYLVTSFFI